MSLIIEPELERRLRARAQEEGVSVHAYLERLMENEVAGIAQTEALLQEAAESGDYIELTDQEWDRIEEEALTAIKAKSPRP
jgi:hypothetical protein